MGPKTGHADLDRTRGWFSSLAWARRQAARLSGGQAAEQEAAEKARLEAFLDAVPAAYCGWSESGAHAASPRFAELLGVDQVSTLEDIEAALAPDDAAALEGLFARLQDTGEGFDVAVRTANDDRRLQLTGARGVAHDQTERFDVLWLRAADTARAMPEPQPRYGELLAALDVLAFPVWLRRADLSLYWCNTAYAEGMGASREQVIANQLEIGAGLSDSSGRAMAEQARSSGRPESDTRHIVLWGTRRLLRITEVPAPDPEIGIGFALDLTREEELQAELSRHISSHAEVLEQLRTAVAIYGADTRLKFYNSAYVELWRLEESWLATQPTFGEVLEELRERRQLPEVADFPRFKRTRVGQFTSLIEPQEELVYRPDGTAIREVVMPHPMGGLLLTQEDVTGRLALESSYNTLIAVQRETLDNLAEGMAVVGGDGKLKLWNPPFAALWNLPPELLNGQPHVVQIVEAMKEFFGGSDADWLTRRTELVNIILDRTPRQDRLERSDGSVLEYRTVPLPDGGILNSFVDVSDSARVETALLERNAALEAADRLKVDFLANVSYQLRTPLNAIMGFAEILSNEYFGPLNARQREYTTGLLQGGERLVSLVDSILDLSSIEAGYMELRLGAVDVRSMLEHIHGLTQDWARKQTLHLDLDCPPNIGFVQADEKRLKQVLLNLISNAIRFTPAGGRIAVSARKIGDELALSVEDTGIGIAAEDQQRVFSPFERASRQPRQSGAGLGLALVKRFIELHGGRVEMRSAPGEGTTVTCFLPVGPA